MKKKVQGHEQRPVQEKKQKFHAVQASGTSLFDV